MQFRCYTKQIDGEEVVLVRADDVTAIMAALYEQYPHAMEEQIGMFLRERSFPQDNSFEG